MEQKRRFWRSRTSHLLDIIMVSVTYFYISFVVAPLQDEIPGLLISAYILGSLMLIYVLFLSQLLHGDTNAERGFGMLRTLFIRTDNLKRSSKEVLLKLTPVMVLGVFILALALGTIWHPEGGGLSTWMVEQGWLKEENLLIDFFGQFVYYIGWGTLQQILFLSFIHVRLRKIFLGTNRNNRIKIALATGAVFGSYHLLNYPLAGFTFISGVFWAWYFYKDPNILTVAISHGLGGTLLCMFVFNPSGWSFSVGLPSGGM
ncbi:MAG: CPBP family intramembrane glutamic endopeptidase [Candidatus Helarchaeota archaeon]